MERGREDRRSHPSPCRRQRGPRDAAGPGHGAYLDSGAAIALGLHFAVLELRPHLFTLLGEPRLLFKLCLTFLLAALSCALVARIARPGVSIRRMTLLRRSCRPCWRPPTRGAPAVPAAEWGQRLVGTNAIFCLKTIPFLAVAPLVAALLALRQGAPEHPALAGAVAGLFAGAISAHLYATHCPDDLPLFVAAWYTLAIGIVAAIGAAAGERLLRW